MLPDYLDAKKHRQPIFFPKKHTKESYRAQQRRAKQRRKQR